MTYASVNGLRLYYEIRGRGRPLVLLPGGLLTIDLNFGLLLEPLAAGRRVIAVELQGHGHTADTARPMTIEALAGDVIALLDQLDIAEADLFGFSRRSRRVRGRARRACPGRQADRRLGGRPSPAGPGERATRRGPDADAYDTVAPDPAHFDEFAAKETALVHEFPGWADELRSLRVPTLLIFGDRDFSPLPDVVELFELLPNAQLAVLPRDHARRRDASARRGVRADHVLPRRALSGGYGSRVRRFGGRSWTPHRMTARLARPGRGWWCR
jgi:pimeloyl-ACP methyl ester carboxylesterase